jgi:hypothetical protein
MNRAQPQYLIVANRRCRTHRPGTTLIYTGPRSDISPGWTCIGRAHQRIEGDET